MSQWLSCVRPDIPYCGLDVVWLEDLPQDVRGLGQLDGPFGLAAVALSVVAGHFELLGLLIDVGLDKGL